MPNFLKRNPRNLVSCSHSQANETKLSLHNAELPSEFQRYETHAKLHEAGYDSFLTARALVRMSTKLHDHSVATGIDKAAADTHPQSVGTSIDRPPPPAKDSNITNLPSTAHTSIDNSNLFSHLSIEETESPLAEDSLRQPMMPPPESTFWASYGNKLRVNGTAEEMCKL